MKKSIFYVFYFFIFCSVSVTIAQNKEDKEPIWISMMNNPNTNYFTAVSEFNNYWKDKERPNEEEVIFNDKKVKKKKAVKYAFEYKKFLQWQKKVFPFVKNDGTIASPTEKINMWEEEKRNRQLNK
ncbi:MAG: hypothetical protein QM535_04615 [Limnohabitans sp.]|nr:hypothetical protein [Limnohabitans sp.]